MHQITKIKGFSDLLWPDVGKYAKMEETAREVFGRYGFSEIRIPVVEKTELFARSIGEETDIVQKEMFTFPDRKGRLLTLRPEATAGVVRAYLENSLYSRDQVHKVFTFGPMFRYERPQKGRQRQFHQVNAELFGANTPQADAELISMLWTYLHALDLGEMTLLLNSLGCPKCRPGFSHTLQAFFDGLPTQELCSDCQRRKSTNPLRVLDCKVPGCRDLVKNAPSILDSLCPECSAHFASVQSILSACSIPFTVDDRLVRGLDYYQRTTFEVVSEHIGAQSSIAGGGRYDDLIRQLGGPERPGIGFACGMERLALLMDQPARTRPDFYLAVLTPEALDRGQILALHLRARRFAGEMSFEPKGPKAQLRHANKLGARYCLLLGEQELQDHTIVVKDMQGGEQQTVDQSNLAAALTPREETSASPKTSAQ